MATRTLKYKELRLTLEKENNQFSEDLSNLNGEDSEAVKNFMEKYRDCFNKKYEGKRCKIK